MGNDKKGTTDPEVEISPTVTNTTDWAPREKDKDDDLNEWRSVD